jgi:sensor histidine kinase regulating citrate/malate metabolism
MEGKIMLTFRDNGMGIDLTKKGDQVFGLYKKFNMSVEGKGIGLFMVKSQVESIGGKIKIKSTPGTGTEFNIELPDSDNL